MKVFGLLTFVIVLFEAGHDASSLTLHMSSDYEEGSSHSSQKIGNVQAKLIVPVTLNFNQWYLQNFLEAMKSTFKLLDITRPYVNYVESYDETPVKRYMNRVYLSLVYLFERLSPYFERSESIELKEGLDNFQKILENFSKKRDFKALAWVNKNDEEVEKFLKFLAQEKAQYINDGSVLHILLEEANSIYTEFMENKLTKLPFENLSRSKVEVRMIDLRDTIRGWYNWEGKTEIWLPVTDQPSLYEKLKKLGSAWQEAYQLLSFLGTFGDAFMETSRMLESGETPPILTLGQLKNLVDEIQPSKLKFPVHIDPNLNPYERINVEQRNAIQIRQTPEISKYLLVLPFIASKD